MYPFLPKIERTLRDVVVVVVANIFLVWNPSEMEALPVISRALLVFPIEFVTNDVACRVSL